MRYKEHEKGKAKGTAIYQKLKTALQLLPSQCAIHDNEQAEYSGITVFG